MLKIRIAMALLGSMLIGAPVVHVYRAVFHTPPAASYDPITNAWTCPVGYSTYASERELAQGNPRFVHCVRP